MLGKKKGKNFCLRRQEVRICSNPPSLISSGCAFYIYTTEVRAEKAEEEEETFKLASFSSPLLPNLNARRRKGAHFIPTTTKAGSENGFQVCSQFRAGKTVKGNSPQDESSLKRALKIKVAFVVFETGTFRPLKLGNRISSVYRFLRNSLCYQKRNQI